MGKNEINVILNHDAITAEKQITFILKEIAIAEKEEGNSEVLKYLYKILKVEQTFRIRIQRYINEINSTSDQPPDVCFK